MTECVIVRIAKADITRVIHEEPAFAELFIAHRLVSIGSTPATACLRWPTTARAKGSHAPVQLITSGFTPDEFPCQAAKTFEKEDISTIAVRTTLRQVNYRSPAGP
jgi:hypothetical protein